VERLTLTAKRRWAGAGRGTGVAASRFLSVTTTEAAMNREISSKPASGSSKNSKPDEGGASVRNAQEWGGGSKASKGPITAADRRNEQSSAKS
jgi:hypothetical protein